MCDTLTENKLMAMLECKCPRCRSGKMFSHSALNLKNFTRMFRNCPVCGLEFEIEPGFFWGAMYVSYFFSVGIAIVSSLAVYLLFNNPEAWVYITTIVSIILLFSTFSFRYSRVLMIFVFSPIKFNKELANPCK